MSRTKLLQSMYNPRRRVSLSAMEAKSDIEQARDSLALMQEMEACRRDEMHTIELSNGVHISSTSLNKLNEYEKRYARMGVKVIRRY